MQAGERGGVADARDALHGRVDLQLVGRDLVGRFAPVLAAWTTRLLTFKSSDATSFSAPSAVEMTLVARLELSTAWLMPAISLRNSSLGDQTGGIIRAAVDSQTGAQSLERVASSVC